MKQERLVKIRRLNINDQDSNFTFKLESVDKNTLEGLKQDAESTDDKTVKDKYYQALSANKQYKKSKILTRESEIIRIVSAINSDNAALDGKNPFVKDLLVINFGRSSKEYGNLADRKLENDKGIITIKNVLDDKIDRFKNLLCSSSNVRTSKAMFIKEDLFKKVNSILLCGIPEDYEFKVFAKYNSYYGLVSTDSLPVSMPNIVVIPDYKNPITEIFDVVKGDVSKEIKAKVGKKQQEKVIGHGQYSVTDNQKLTYEIMPFDGAGLVDVSRMQLWANELSLDYIPSAVQFRAIPGIKGNLYTFDLKAYAAQLKAEGKSTTIIDYWGKEWDFEQDQIDCIMTKSQFKFADIFKDLATQAGTPNDGFRKWFDEFIKPVKIGKDKFYQRTFNLSEISEPYSELKDKCVLSYQPLQTLKFTSSEIAELCEETIKLVLDVHQDMDEFLRYRGLKDTLDNKADRIPPFYKALKKNHVLYYDPYIRKQIKEDLKSLKYRCYTGKLFTDGNYQVFSPDVLGLAEAAFGQPVNGLLKAGQIYSNYWCSNKVDEVDIIRSPHIATEHFVVNVIKPVLSWFKYQDTGIVTSMWDSLALRLNSADYDGDHVLSVSSPPIIAAAKRANINTILWDRTDNPSENNQLVPISNIDKIINTSVVGMQNKIGDVINKISILWSLPQTRETQDAIKIMSVIGSLTIDFAKSGEKAQIPPDIKALLKEKKKPEWMKYRHKSDIRTDAVLQSNSKIYNVDSKSSFDYRKDCTMQRICDYMKSQIQIIEEKFDQTTNFVEQPHINKLLMLKFIKANVYKESVRYNKIKETLLQLQEDYQIINNEIFHDPDDSKDQKEENDMRFKVFFEYCRDKLIISCNNVAGGEIQKLDTLIDYLLYIYYIEPQFTECNKAILWNAFANEMFVRCSNGELNNSIDLNQVQKRLYKSKDRIKRIKSNSYLVKISQFDNMQEIEIKISQSELVQVCSALTNEQDKKLYLILLGLYRKNGNKPFKIGSFGKHTINQSQICKLARFDKDARQYKKSISNLIDKGFLGIDENKSSKQPTIIVNDKFLVCGSNDVCEVFSDINDYARYINQIPENPEKVA